MFVEKPPAETLEDCLAMKEAAERAGRHVMVGFMKRFSEPYVRAARRSPRARSSGRVTAYEARFTFGVYPPRAVYDFLNGFGCHHLDLARFLMGEVAWVFAARVSRAEGDTARVAAERARASGGRLGLAGHVAARRRGGSRPRRRRGRACSASRAAPSARSS